MRLPRLSIAALMGLILFVAVAIATLRNADELWTSILLSLALLNFGVAALGAAFRRGRSRAFSAGAAFFGFGYLGLAFGPISPQLASTKLLDYAYPRIHASTVLTFSGPIGSPDTLVSRYVS